MANNNTDNLIKELTKAIIESNKANQTHQVNEEGASNVALQINKKINDRSANQRSYAARVSKEMSQGINCVTIVVPRIYAEYQPSFVVSINGCTIKVPADGKPRVVHKDYAVILRRRMNALDKKIDFMRSNPNGEIKQL